MDFSKNLNMIKENISNVIDDFKIFNENMKHNINYVLDKEKLPKYLKMMDSEKSKELIDYLKFIDPILADEYFSSLNNNHEQIEVGPFADDNGKDFIDCSFNELVGMSLVTVKKKLLDSISSLEDLPENERKETLQRLISKILSFQSTNTSFGWRDYDKDEQRFYADLISTPGFLNDPMVSEFLKNDFRAGDITDVQKHKLLLKIRDYYENHDGETIDKFNYIFKSSDLVSVYLMANENSNLDEWFPKDFLSLFSKDDLAFLYRFNFNYAGRFEIRNFTNSDNRKAVFVLAQFSKKLNQCVGANHEYLDAMKNVLRPDSQIVPLLNSYYDYVGASEEKFFDAIDFNDNLGTAELVSFILECGSCYGFKYKGSTSIVDFLEKVDSDRKNNHEVVLGKGCVEKICYGVYEQSDIPTKGEYTTTELKNFKQAFLMNIYGISLNQAEYIKEFYGKHLEEFYKGLPVKDEAMSIDEYLNSLDESKIPFKKEDYGSLQVLTSICNICDLSKEDVNYVDKIKVLQVAYLRQMQQKGVLSKSKYVSFPVLESALNNLYMNSFSKRLMSVADSKKIIGFHDDVILLDAGVEFDMLVSSIGAVGKVFDSNVNMAVKWNTATGSDCSGLCTSHISSQNLGVFTIASPILGFQELDGISLNMMGTSDIYSYTYEITLRSENRATVDRNRSFVPGSIMADETRYGYNELLIDRFVNDDSNDNKLQPSYIVYFKFDDNYKDDFRFKNSVKIAQDFNIPVMVVDVYKIKEYERQQINQMKEELFSSDKVDKELMTKIITRYMNNYVGAANFVGYFRGWKAKDQFAAANPGKKYENKYPVDFSEADMEEFFNTVFDKIDKIGDKESANEWISALEEAYFDEQRKYNESQRVSPESYSVRYFILDDLLLDGRILDAKKDVLAKFGDDTLEQSDESKDDSTKSFEDATLVSDMTLSSQTAYQLIGAINQNAIIDMEKDSENNCLLFFKDDVTMNDVVANSLVLSYFFENTDSLLLMDLVSNNGKEDIKFSAKSSYKFSANILKSPLKDRLLNKDFDWNKVDELVSRISSLDDSSIVKPFVSLATKKANGDFDKTINAIDNLLYKKSKIAKEFDKLKSSINALTGEITNSDGGKKL